MFCILSYIAQTKTKRLAGFLGALYILFLFAIGLIVIWFLLLFKSSHLKTTNYMFAIYTLSAFIFFLSRISASFLYQLTKNHNGNYEQKTDYFPSVSFVIPVKNEEKVVFSTIRHCYEADYPQEKIEVIVINDGSTDNTWREIERAKKVHPELKTINWRENRGKRHGVAAGVRWAKGDIFIQLDSDSWIERGSLKILVSYFKDLRVAGVVAHTDPSNKDDSWLTKMQTAYYFVSFKIQKAAESAFDLVFCCSGCCSAYRREFVLPSLSEWLEEKHLGVKTTYGDDRALTNLMIKQGYKTIYSDEAQAYTVVPNNLKQFIKQQQRWKKGWIVNTIRISKFITKRDPMVAFTYIYPQIIFNFITPLVIFNVLVYHPLVYHQFPFAYLLGLFLLYIIYVLCCIGYRNKNYNRYLFIWGFVNTFMCGFVLPYAVFTLRDTKWGTR